MKFVVALLLNYVAAIQLNERGVDQPYEAGHIDSGHYSWKYSGMDHIVNETEWVADTPKAYQALKVKNKDVKATGNDLVDEQNRIKEKKAVEASKWNEFDGSYHLDDGTRKLKDGKVVKGVNLSFAQIDRKDNESDKSFQEERKNAAKVVAD